MSGGYDVEDVERSVEREEGRRFFRYPFLRDAVLSFAAGIALASILAVAVFCLMMSGAGV